MGYSLVFNQIRYVLCLLFGIAFSKLNDMVQGMRIKHDHAEPICTFGFM